MAEYMPLIEEHEEHELIYKHEEITWVIKATVWLEDTGSITDSILTIGWESTALYPAHLFSWKSSESQKT